MSELSCRHERLQQNAQSELTRSGVVEALTRDARAGYPTNPCAKHEGGQLDPGPGGRLAPRASGALSVDLALAVSAALAVGLTPEDIAIPVEAAAGDIAQVDFGYVGKLYDAALRRAGWAQRAQPRTWRTWCSTSACSHGVTNSAAIAALASPARPGTRGARPAC